MDFVKNAFGGNKEHDNQAPIATPVEEKKGGFNFGDAINGALGGGKASEANEGIHDDIRLPRQDSVDAIQEHVLGQGDQSNESAAEQFKDEQISDAIRVAWKNTTGQELPIKDKQH
ncbi:hypothetical protein P389DRAFT_192296 [Cystobasidium minutum MCA 4210]|uniref:uncharacterized protein n=1 Tax=Cystobasidium minutum MCA 4210 TaxID=1397322 RepID=UPI0034CF70B2|eukprot:jgi/Rhomi1/192296/gm1.510_g